MFHTVQPSIEDLFRYRFYTIPDFQRDYVWKAENINDLFSDIRDETNQLKANLEEGKYFLGNVVLIGDWESNRGSFTVIDGQQRITTLMLIFKILEQEIKEKDPNTNPRVIMSIQDMYGHYEEDNENYKVRLNHEKELSYSKLFKEYIKGEVDKAKDLKIESESERNIREVYSTISDILSSYEIGDLNYLAKYLKSRVFVSVTSTEDMSVAYRVFETLNKRGTELDATDLIKNRLISYIVNNSEDDEDKDKFVQTWNETIDFLTRTKYKKDIVDTSKFLKHYIIGMYGVNIRKSNIFDWFNKKVKSDFKSTKEVIKLTKDLKKAAELYGNLYRGKFETFETESSKDLRITLQVLGYQQMYSLFIMFRDRSDEEKRRIASTIMRYAAVLVFTKTQANQAEDRIEQLARDYNKMVKAEPQKALEEFVENIEKWIQQNSILVKKLIANEIFEDRNGNLNINGRKLLKMLAIVTSESEEGDLKKWSVEHIMPLTVEETILQDYEIETVEEHSDFKNRIGNLTPLESDLNTSGSNKSFDQKLKVYNESTYYLITKRIQSDLKTIMKSGSVSDFYKKINANTASYNKWNRETIEERSQEIGKLFVNIVNDNF